MIAIAMEVCPLCATCPTVAGRWRVQVRCRCGACGPRMKSEEAAIGRWNSVVGFVREWLRSGAPRSAALPEAAEAAPATSRRPRGFRRLARALTWQYGLKPELEL